MSRKPAQTQKGRFLKKKPQRENGVADLATQAEEEMRQVEVEVKQKLVVPQQSRDMLLEDEYMATIIEEEPLHIPTVAELIERIEQENRVQGLWKDVIDSMQQLYGELGNSIKLVNGQIGFMKNRLNRVQQISLELDKKLPIFIGNKEEEDKILLEMEQQKKKEEEEEFIQENDQLINGQTVEPEGLIYNKLEKHTLVDPYFSQITAKLDGQSSRGLLLNSLETTNLRISLETEPRLVKFKPDQVIDEVLFRKPLCPKFKEFDLQSEVTQILKGMKIKSEAGRRKIEKIVEDIAPRSKFDMKDRFKQGKFNFKVIEQGRSSGFVKEFNQNNNVLQGPYQGFIADEQPEQQQNPLQNLLQSGDDGQIEDEYPEPHYEQEEEIPDYDQPQQQYEDNQQSVGFNFNPYGIKDRLPDSNKKLPPFMRALMANKQKQVFENEQEEGAWMNQKFQAQRSKIKQIQHREQKKPLGLPFKFEFERIDKDFMDIKKENYASDDNRLMNLYLLPKTTKVNRDDFSQPFQISRNYTSESSDQKQHLERSQQRFDIDMDAFDEPNEPMVEHHRHFQEFEVQQESEDDLEIQSDDDEKLIKKNHQYIEFHYTITEMKNPYEAALEPNTFEKQLPDIKKHRFKNQAQIVDEEKAQKIKEAIIQDMERKAAAIEYKLLQVRKTKEQVKKVSIEDFQKDMIGKLREEEDEFQTMKANIDKMSNNDNFPFDENFRQMDNYLLDHPEFKLQEEDAEIPQKLMKQMRIKKIRAGDIPMIAYKNSIWSNFRQILKTGGKKGVKFSDITKIMPEMLQEEYGNGQISIQECFIAMLQLSNENGLKLCELPRQEDFEIRVES